MDLAALLVTVHFTGGLASPLLVFFGFHMAIGTILIAPGTMYVLAGGTSLGALTTYLLELRGVLERHPVGGGLEPSGLICELNLLTLVIFLFGTVYLTHSVASRVKRRNIELHETTEALTERTTDLQALVREMEDVQRRKSYYMRISAHQLRSPLATVKTSLQVLNDGYLDPGSDRGRALLRGAGERVDGLLAIVNDLLELAKIREGQARAPWCRDVNVNQLLADLFDSLGPFAEERQVRMVPDFRGVAILDWGVPPDLVFAFENLIHNAVKYSYEGGEVSVWLRTVDETAIVRVIDQGIGVPLDVLDRVFLEFVRAPNARKHSPGGTGLGLAIVQQVAKAHGGRATVESREGVGSVFRVELPLHAAPAPRPFPLPGGNEGSYGSATPSRPLGTSEGTQGS
jgi:signal transduction histidine kinase